MFQQSTEIQEALAKPAEQHQGEPVMLTAAATLIDDGDGGLAPSWLLEGGTAELFAGMTLLVAENAPDLCQEDGSAEVYTHADPGEIERLRESLRLEKAKGELLNDARVKAEELQWAAERKLTERDALLRDAALHASWMEPNSTAVLNRIKAVLRASAEPIIQAPTSEEQGGAQP